MEMTKEKFNRLLVECKDRVVGGAAMVELYGFFFHKIVAHVAYKFGNRDIGEDIAQNFFMKILRTDIVCEIENPFAWVCKICDNLTKDYFKQDRRAKRIFTPEAFLNKDDLLDKVIHGEYHELIKQLDPTTQQIIELHIFEGLNLKEIAAELKLNHGTVRKRFSRGMKELRKKMKK